MVAACAGEGASAEKAVNNVATRATLVSAFRVRLMMVVFLRVSAPLDFDTCLWVVDSSTDAPANLEPALSSERRVR